MSKGKKRKSVSPNSVQPALKNDSEYDVTLSMKRVRQYRPRKDDNNFRQHTDSNGDCSYSNQRLNNQCDGHNHPTSEPTRDYYFHLDDKISDFSNRNESAHSDIRKEFESKLNGVADKIDNCNDKLHDKVDFSIFVKIIIGFLSGIVVIIGAWYTISYAPLINSNEKHIENIHLLDKRIEHLENNSTPIDTISKQK